MPIQNNHYCQYIPPSICAYTSGVWNSQAGSVPGTIVRRLTGSAGAKIFKIPVPLLSSPTQLTGSRLMSLEIDYEIATDVLTADSLIFRRTTRGADGSPAVVDVLAHSYDTDHDLIAERGAIGIHRMLLTLTVQPWIDNDQHIHCSWSITKNANTVFYFYGAFANFYWRD